MRFRCVCTQADATEDGDKRLSSGGGGAAMRWSSDAAGSNEGG